MLTSVCSLRFSGWFGVVIGLELSNCSEALHPEIIRLGSKVWVLCFYGLGFWICENGYFLKVLRIPLVLPGLSLATSISCVWFSSHQTQIMLVVASLSNL